MSCLLVEGIVSIPHLMSLNLSALLTGGTPITPTWSSLSYSCYIQIHKLHVSGAVGGGVTP